MSKPVRTQTGVAGTPHVRWSSSRSVARLLLADRARGRGLLPAIGVVLAAALCGVLLASHLSRGVGLVVALVYVPLVVLQLPIALALWVATLFVSDLPVVSIGPSAAALLILGAWLATLRDRRATVNAVLGGHRLLVAGAVLLVVWLTLSLLWARDPGVWISAQWRWYVALLCGLIVATSVTSRRHVHWILVAFVAGAVASVTIGLLAGGLNQSTIAGVGPATQTEGRLQGGSSDPNLLAAGLIPAIVFAATLFGATRRVAWRTILLLGIGILTVGLAATQSRGGALAAAVAALAALALYKHQRPQMLALIGVMVSCAFVWFAANPGSWARVTSYSDRGAGRADLWQVAWRMAHDHPIVGVGLGNFTDRAPEYVNQPGGMTFVDLIVERPRVVHNAYLELLAETGVLGLLLYLFVVAACLRAAWRAAGRFDAQGDRTLASAARAVMISTLAMLVAGVFLSYGWDPRMWVLFALGPALLALSGRHPGGAAAAPAGPADRLAR